MTLVKEYKNCWIIFCPGCKCIHVIDSTWAFNGNYEKPTFRPSLLVNGNPQFKNLQMPRCHSFITEGEITFLPDCTHELAGKTVRLTNA
jgi:hypothetical protein